MSSASSSATAEQKAALLETYHIGYLFSVPLIGQFGVDQPQAIDTLDIEKEKDKLFKALQQTKRAVRLRMEAATTDNLRTLVTMGCRALHYTGHGHKSCLCFEDGVARMHPLDSETLRELFRAGGGAMDVQLVFVSACHSEPAGLAFVSAHVPHVIAVKSEDKIADTAAQDFMYHFYLSLMVGRTVKESFEAAKVAVKTKLSHADEATKFLLLPKDGNHAVKLFDNVSIGTIQDDTPPPAPNNLPAVPDNFSGRNFELQDLIANIVERRRLVTLIGEPGIGKSTLVKAAGRYLMLRRVFVGVIWVPLVSVFSSPRENLASLICKLIPWAGLLKANPTANSAAAYDIPRCTNNDDLFRYIGEQELLFLLDGAEVLSEAEPATELCLRTFINDLLQNCQRVKIIVTSLRQLSNGTLNVPELVLPKLAALPAPESAKLFYALAPRYLSLEDINCTEEESALTKLANHPAVIKCGGIPKRIFNAAQLLSEDKKMSDLPVLIDENEAKIQRNDQERAKQRYTSSLHRLAPRKYREFEEKLATHIKDPGARELWKGAFIGQDSGRWEEIESVLVRHFTETCRDPLEADYIKNFKDKMFERATPDEKQNGIITIQRFAKFWLWFSAFERTYLRVKPWLEFKLRVIHGFLSKEDSDKMIKGMPEGTFLVRFSLSLPGCLAVDYVDKDPSNSSRPMISRVRINVVDREPEFLLQLADGDRCYPTLPVLVTDCAKLKFLYPNIDKNRIFGDGRPSSHGHHGQPTVHREHSSSNANRNNVMPPAPLSPLPPPPAFPFPNHSTSSSSSPSSSLSSSFQSPSTVPLLSSPSVSSMSSASYPPPAGSQSPMGNAPRSV